jgi:hypothetical protein
MMNASQPPVTAQRGGPARSYRALRPYLSRLYYAASFTVARPVVGEIPRLIYGNDAGLLNNVRAERGLRRLRGGRSAGEVLDPRVRQFRDEGYVMLLPAYDRALLAAICRDVERLIEDPQHSIPRADGNASRTLVTAIEKIPALRHLLDKEIRDLLEAYYGTHVGVTSVSVWRNRAVPGYDGKGEVYSNFWHCDDYLTSRVKLFVNLSDVTRETGAFRLIPVSSTKQIMRSGYLTRYWALGRARTLLEDTSRVVYAEGPVGSAILANTQRCLHAASIPRPGSLRDIVEFKFDPSSRPLAADWVRHLAVDPYEARFARGLITRK